MGLKVVGEKECGTPRLRREDYTHVQHCKVFSSWAVLIGPSDWGDHDFGKEGSERYRVHNLPLSCSCPGLYELGIASPHSVLGSRRHKLKCQDVVVVYLGQADNIRTRLQHYGRAGSHLEGKSSFSLNQKWNASFQQSKWSYDEHVKQGPGLFTDIFSKGFSITFRWAAMNTKARAEESEARLLKVFDYAWNRGGNVARRPDDVLLKLKKLTSQGLPVLLLRRLAEIQRIAFEKKAGIRIEGKKPSETGKQTIPTVSLKAFSFTRNRLRSVHEKGANNIETLDTTGTNICAVVKEDGSICSDAPLKNRKRCGHHKGDRITKESNSAVKTDTKIEENRGVVKNNNECGVVLEDGSACRNLPDNGRKRCNIHKGMRVCVQTS